ncbi:MAG TPA: type II secretion system F family protein [Bryobacteraceae bacterium]|nr:type II secretion system F family protein [Bryobacteraceae bacterium]
MLNIVIVVFAAVFLVAVLLLSVIGAERSKQAQQTISRLRSLVIVGSGSAEDGLDLRKQERLSQIPWLNRQLVRVNIFPRLQLLLYQANVKLTVGALLLLSTLCWMATAMAVNWRTGATLLAVGIGALAAAVPFVYVLWRRASRFSAFEQLLPDALNLMVGALRAGHSLTSSIGMVGREIADPISREFRKCFDEQMFGIETRVAMVNLVNRVPIQPVRIIATVVLIQKETGGNLAEVLEKAAYVIRERFKLRRQVRVHTAQGRMSGWILAILPVVLGFLLYFINPEHFSLLWRRPLGLKMLYGAALMQVVGTLIIRRIINIRI